MTFIKSSINRKIVFSPCFDFMMRESIQLCDLSILVSVGENMCVSVCGGCVSGMLMGLCEEDVDGCVWV